MNASDVFVDPEITIRNHMKKKKTRFLQDIKLEFALERAKPHNDLRRGLRDFLDSHIIQLEKLLNKVNSLKKSNNYAEEEMDQVISYLDNEAKGLISQKSFLIKIKNKIRLQNQTQTPGELEENIDVILKATPMKENF